MRVGVDEARDDSRAAQVNALRGRPRIGGNIVTNGQNPAVFHGQCPNFRLSLVNCVNCCVFNDQIGLLFWRQRGCQAQN
jgi:hypothetical protein